MTTGQRIAAKRKERELSQESLGAELGVSRQTVYKWESDTSLPEIEKLVALSRLFHLPVGVLLGVEEAAAAEPPRPVPRWKRRLWPLLSAALGAVCVVLVLRVNTLQSGQADRLLAAALADGLVKRGMKLVSGGTDNHLMLLDLRDEECTGKELEARLDSVHITANKNTIPNDPQSPFVTSGIRLGTPAVTSRGLNTEDMDQVAEAIAMVIKGGEEQVPAARAIVQKLTDKYPLI